MWGGGGFAKVQVVGCSRISSSDDRSVSGRREFVELRGDLCLLNNPLWNEACLLAGIPTLSGLVRW